MSVKAFMQNDDIKSMKERVRWAIGYICDNYNMTNEKIGKDIGCSTSAVNSYRRMITVPGMNFLAYMQKYNFSLKWLTSGKGEPFADECDKFPEIYKKEKSFDLKETMVNYEQNNNAHLPPIRISDAIIMCTRVLESGTSYATALYFSIQHFDHALEIENYSKKCQDDLNSFKKEFMEMKNRLENIEKENIRLHTDIQKLMSEDRQDLTVE